MPSPTSTPTPIHDHHIDEHSPHLQRQNSIPGTSSISPSVASGSGYFTFPVTYSVNGLLRRLSGDTIPSTMARKSSAGLGTQSSLPKSLSSSFSSWTARSSGRRSSSNSPTEPRSLSSSLHNTAYAPAPIPRTHSPFQPPPLTPLTLVGHANATPPEAKVLGTALAEEIRLLVPARLQLVEEWDLIFGLERDGVSLATLYSKCEAYRGKRGGFVLVVRDESGGVFGAFLTDAPHPSSHYYGTGECFLWRASILSSIPGLSSLPPPPSADTTNASRMTTLAHTNGDGSATPDRIRFKAFPYSGINDYMIFCQSDFLSVGGG
jgi:TLD